MGDLSYNKLYYDTIKSMYSIASCIDQYCSLINTNLTIITL